MAIRLLSQGADSQHRTSAAAAAAAGCQGDSDSRQTGLREPYLNLSAAYSQEASNQGDILF